MTDSESFIKKHKNTLIIIALAIVAIFVYFSWDAIKAFAKKVKEGIQNKVVTPIKEAVSKFPVTLASSTSDIYDAFVASGYIAQLTNAVQQGQYPDTYLTNAKNDPKGWLETHPYLYTAFPDYFKMV